MDLLIAALLWIQDQQEKPKTPYDGTITVQQAQVRETARSLSKVLATLKEKDVVTVLELKDGKARVKTAAGIEGWVPETSVMESKAYVAKEQAAGSDPKKSAESSAYAKGFDPETETRMKSEKNLTEQYKMVDKVEATPPYLRDPGVLDQKLTEFRRAGHLGEFHQ